MTVYQPLPDNTSVIEPKVKWASIATYVASALLMGLVNLLSDNDNQLLIEVLPDSVEWLILPLVPMAVAFAAGFSAKHQWRTAEVNQNIPRQGGGF